MIVPEARPERGGTRGIGGVLSAPARAHPRPRPARAGQGDGDLGAPHPARARPARGSPCGSAAPPRRARSSARAIGRRAPPSAISARPPPRRAPRRTSLGARSHEARPNRGTSRAGAGREIVRPPTRRHHRQIVSVGSGTSTRGSRPRAPGDGHQASAMGPEQAVADRVAAQHVSGGSCSRDIASNLTRWRGADDLGFSGRRCWPRRLSTWCRRADRDDVTLAAQLHRRCRCQWVVAASCWTSHWLSKAPAATLGRGDATDVRRRGRSPTGSTLVHQLGRESRSRAPQRRRRAGQYFPARDASLEDRSSDALLEHVDDADVGRELRLDRSSVAVAGVNVGVDDREAHLPVAFVLERDDQAAVAAGEATMQCALVASTLGRSRRTRCGSPRRRSARA